MRCAIWYYLHNLKNVKNTHGVVLLFLKLQAEVAQHTTYDSVLEVRANI